jgi:amino acid permease
VIATYIGVTLYIILYFGFTLWERFHQTKRPHFVPLLDVDLETDAVWISGQGATTRERDRLEVQASRMEKIETRGIFRTFWSDIKKHVY